MIEVEGLVRRFGATVAVDGVSFRVAQGEFLALVGFSGSGKTTTLKMINRLVEPTAGRVVIEGADTAAQEPHALRRRIGYVFQKVGLFPHLTVEENVALPLLLAEQRRSDVQARVAEVLALMELDPALGRHFPRELSGGQEQRVGVARALVASPRLVLFDEPFGALDPITRDRLQQSLLRLRSELKLTGIVVTHDMAEALLLADRIGVMRAGRMVQIGTAAELLRAPADPLVSEMLESPLRQARLLQRLAGGPA